MRVVIDAIGVVDRDHAGERTGYVAYRRRRRSEASAVEPERRDHRSRRLRTAAAVVELKIDVPVRPVNCGRVDRDAANNTGRSRHDRRDQQSRDGDYAFCGGYKVASQDCARKGQKVRPADRLAF